MGQLKQQNLDHIHFENVSLQNEGFDPVLVHVDLELPMDQTVIIKSTNPVHSVRVLEMLAGRKLPHAGKIKWIDESRLIEFENTELTQELVASYFESNRPDPNIKLADLFKSTGAHIKMIEQACEYFELSEKLDTKFRDLPYEYQKLILLLVPTFKKPQLLILEDPAVGLSEYVFLNFLDWIQLWQRQGFLRHIYLTNNHPVAARHLEASLIYVEDGLIYLDSESQYKKIVHF